MALNNIKKNNKRLAITLIELIIALTITTTTMVLLFSVVTKKVASTTDYSERGEYYCWKDWNGNLYQKQSSGNIEQVSQCVIKVPNFARNIKVHVIGGGSGGFGGMTDSELDSKFELGSMEDKVDKTCIDEKVFSYDISDARIMCNANNPTKKYTVSRSCTNINGRHVCTDSFDNVGNLDFQFIKDRSKDYSQPNSNMYHVNGKPLSNFVRVNTYISYGAIRSLNTSVNNTKISPTGDLTTDHLNIDSSLFGHFRQNGYCCIKVYDVRSANPVPNYRKLPSDCYYYSSGNSGTCTDNGDYGYKYINAGYCLNSSLGRISLSQGECTGSDINKLNYNYNKLSIVGDTFKKSNPGEYIQGTVAAGKTYTIKASDIGNGGAAGQNGYATTFSGFVAEGGVAESLSETKYYSGKINISNISDIQQQKEINICDDLYDSESCSGYMNKEFLAQNEKSNIVINQHVQLTPSFDKNNLDSETQTGFGLFGAGGIADNYSIKYYPINSFNYNKYSYSAPSTKEVNSKNSFNNGMGGAVIITWE